jgi:hypothetical protein
MDLSHNLKYTSQYVKYEEYVEHDENVTHMRTVQTTVCLP